MNENLRKTLIYFGNWESYWKLTNQNEKTKINLKNLERYPLDFKPRILESHYRSFDKEGIPAVFDPTGNIFRYRYTTMCSFALGHSDFYIVNGEKSHLDKLTTIADFILNKGVIDDDGILLKEMDHQGNFNGKISSMIQGEAMSVLTRAYELTEKEEYLNYAIRLLPAFEKNMENNGVVGIISKNECKWYEEYPFYPLNHVLNGMIYSLWGLRDLHMASNSEKAGQLFSAGVDYVSKSLCLFDTGFWSYYRLAEQGKNYVASMMYHNLHICQLQALYSQTGIELFREFAEKFIKYTKNPVNRSRAANAIFLAKLSRRLSGKT